MPELARWKRLCAVVGLCCLSACGSLLGPRTVELSQAQMQQWMERQFPIDRRLLEWFDVSVGTPRLSLRPESNRIGTEFELGVSVFKVPHRGSLMLGYGMRLEPADNTLRLTDVRLERFAVDGAPAPLQRRLEGLVGPLLEQALNDRVVYTLRPQDIEAVRGRGYRPSDVRVTPTGLAVTLQPADAR